VPIVQEAAKIGLYSFDFFAQASMTGQHRAHVADHARRALLGRRGIGLAIFGSGLAAAGIAGNGTPSR